MKVMKPKKMVVKKSVVKKDGKMIKMEKMSKTIPSGFASHIAMMGKK